MIYYQTCNISHTIVDHSDVVGASPLGAAPTASSFSTWHLYAMDWAKSAARWDKKHWSFGIWCNLYYRFHISQITPRYLQLAPVPWVAGQRYGVSFVSSKYDLYSESLHCYIQYCVWTGPCYNGIQQFMAPVLLITMSVDGPGLVWVDPMKTIKLDILSLNFLWLLKILNIYLRPWNFFQEWWSGCMKAHRTLLSVNSFGHHSNHFIDMGHHRFI